MALLTLAQLKEHIEAELADDALTRLLNGADQAVEQRYGAIATQVDEFVVSFDLYPNGRDKYVNLTRQVSSITSVTEQLYGGDADTLAADDYDLRGRSLERLNSGTNSRNVWGHRVVVTYVPYDDTNQRIPVIVDLVKIELGYRGLHAERASDYSMTAAEYQKERESILGALGLGLNFA